jgi:hypothetical protein
MTRMENGCFSRGHDAIWARVQRESTQALLRVEIDRPIWGEDECPDVKPRFDPNGGPDNEGHVVRGGQLDERSQTRITLREGQIIGEIQLVTCQRQLRKDEHPCLPFCRGTYESNVAFKVGFDVTALWDRLGDS